MLEIASYVVDSTEYGLARPDAAGSRSGPHAVQPVCLREDITTGAGNHGESLRDGRRGCDARRQDGHTST